MAKQEPLSDSLWDVWPYTRFLFFFLHGFWSIYVSCEVYEWWSTAGFCCRSTALHRPQEHSAGLLAVGKKLSLNFVGKRFFHLLLATRLYPWAAHTPPPNTTIQHANVHTAVWGRHEVALRGFWESQTATIHGAHASPCSSVHLATFQGKASCKRDQGVLLRKTEAVWKENMT